MNKRYQVFVSSTYKDLIEYRQLVIKSLMQIDALPAGMESFPAADEDAWSIIKRTIDQCDYYMVIIGGRYGSCNEAGTGYTELEYDYAESQKKPIMAFLHGSPEKLPREATETDPAQWNKLTSFRKKAERRHCKYWNSKEELILHVLTSYPHTVANHPSAGWVRGDQAKTVAEMERLAYLERKVAEQEEELRKLREPLKDVDDPTFVGGDDPVKIHLRSEPLKNERTVTTTWNQLFVMAASEATKAPKEYDIFSVISSVLREMPGDPITPAEDGLNYTRHITAADAAMIKTQFLALGLIQIEHLPETDLDRRGRGSGLMTVWKLTDKAMRRLVSLTALRRPPADPSKTSEPAGAPLPGK